MSNRLRRIFFWIHLGVGLLVSLFFLVMCATGVALAFRPQLERHLNHWGVSSRPPIPGAQPLPIETLIEHVRENAGGFPQSVTVYPDAHATVDVYLGRDDGTVYVDAYTGAIIGRPSKAIFAFFAGLMDWHTAMGLHSNKRLGATLIDAANLMSFVVIVLGVYLWIPRRWTWRHVQAVLVFRPRLTGKARDFNWHNVIGIWTLLPMMIMVWSGVALSYGWADRLTLKAVALIPRGEGFPRSRSIGAVNPDSESASPQAKTVGLDALLDQAKARLPGWKSIRFTVPDSMTETIHFTIDPTGYGLVKGGFSSQLQLTRSGEEVGFQGPRHVKGRGIYRFAHTGELWGEGGQTAAMLGSFGGVVLVWTGASLSLRRFRAYVRG
jgi:uncharacterized iron-regulated membrane protein